MPKSRGIRASGNDRNERLNYHGWTVTDLGCWEWRGALNEHGYGWLKWKQKYWLAHRFAYDTWVGNIPDGQVVCHACDNPKCINPKHLWLGTPAQNRMDMYTKGRHGRKLTRDQAEEIRLAYSFGDSNQQIAKRYNISKGMVRQITSGKAWNI
jgi:hypothetical protein